VARRDVAALPRQAQPRLASAPPDNSAVDDLPDGSAGPPRPLPAARVDMSDMPASPAREPVAARILVVADRVAAAMVVAVADMWRMPNLLRAAVVAVRILAVVAVRILAAAVDRILAAAAVRMAAVVAATEVGVAVATGAAAITSRL
jgi:hypothetical protein